MAAKDIIERMRKKQGLPTPAEPPPQKPIARPPEAKKSDKPKGSKGPRPPKPPQPVDHTIKLTRACGHQDDYGVILKEKPEWEANRRKKWQGKLCAACRATRDAEEVKKQSELKAQRKAKKPWKPRPRTGFRFPHGTCIVATYDEKAQHWTATLGIPLLVATVATDYHQLAEFLDHCDLSTATEYGIHGAIEKLGQDWFRKTFPNHPMPVEPAGKESENVGEQERLESQA